MSKVSMAVIASLAFGTLVAGAPVANATGGTCHAYAETYKRDWFRPDDHRVRAICSSLDGDSKAQGVLDVDWAPDLHTQWFTSLNKSYYSGWGATGEDINGAYPHYLKV